MSSDDLVARVHQQAQGEHQAEVMQTLTLFKAWLEAAYGLLAETRRHLPAFIATSEQLLEPLSIKHSREVGRGRQKKTVFEVEPIVGWELAKWDTYGGWNNDVHIFGRYYLLHDGRLLSAEKPKLSIAPPNPGDLIGDRLFLVMLPEEDRNSTESQPAVSKIGLLFERAALTAPKIPPLPSYYRQGFKHLQRHEWDALRRQYVY